MKSGFDLWSSNKKFLPSISSDMQPSLPPSPLLPNLLLPSPSPPCICTGRPKEKYTIVFLLLQG